MPKKRVADIARERGLEPAEVARRLAEAGVKLSGDAVDEAAAARALGGSRPARSKISAVAAAPARVPVPTAPVGSSRPSATAPSASGAPAGSAPPRSGAPSQGSRPAGSGRVDGPGVSEGGGARPRPGPGTPGSLPPRLSRPQRSGAAAGRRRRVVIDTGAARPARDTRNQGRGRGRGGGDRSDKREEAVAPTGPVTVPSGVTVKDLATTLSVSTAVIQKTMMGLGELVGITQSLTDDAVELIGTELEREITITHAADEVEAAEVFDDEAEDLESRAPVVTIMGHVDHGKTSLLDAIRETSVVSTEAGGITQHIGAYQATVDGRRVTFLDTPGHEAFTAMRARGANATDIVVLVVAADDGVMPQTIEAIDHAKAAEVPIVVAVNKVDRPDANPERVRQELTSHGLQPEEWGGQTIFVDVSAREKTGLSNLLEMLLLQADVLELRANPKADASGLIIESRLDIGRGPVATVLVQRGTMHPGAAVVAGDAWGKVRAMYDHTGARLKDAGPAVPVEILGFDHPPVAGERARVVDSERTARQQAQQRAQRLRAESLARRQKTISLEHLFDAVKAGGIRELNLIIKARRAGLGRGRARRGPEDQERRGRRPRDPHGRRCDRRVGHQPGRRVDRDRRRVQRPTERRGQGARRSRGRRRPHLPRHLPADRGHREGPRRTSRTGHGRGHPRRGRGARAVPQLSPRRDRGLHGHDGASSSARRVSAWCARERSSGTATSARSAASRRTCARSRPGSSAASCSRATTTSRRATSSSAT